MSGRFYAGGVESADQLLTRALDLGITLIDMADVYASEAIVGSSLRHRASEVVLSTKGGLISDDDAPFDFRPDGRPEHLRRALDASLERLGVDSIDLYYLHRVDPEVPVEESVGALAEGVAAGKIRAIGLSEVSLPTLERAQAVHPISAIQMEYSLWSRESTSSHVRWCEMHDALLVAYCPLGRGFLAGNVPTQASTDTNDIRSTHPRFTEQALKENQRILAVLRTVAARHGATPAQVSLAWLLAQASCIVPIPGMERLEFVHQNAAAAHLSLDQEDLDSLDAVPQPTQDRYPVERSDSWSE